MDLSKYKDVFGKPRAFKDRFLYMAATDDYSGQCDFVGGVVFF
jgi:hypothetical protein